MIAKGNNILAESGDSAHDSGGGSDDEPSLFEDSLEIHGIDWVAVFAYFDETGTHDAEEVVVAGYLFSKDGAKLFRRLFFEKVSPLLPLDKHGRRMYRTGKCVGGYDQFGPLTEPQRERIVNSMADIIVSSAMLGVVVGIDKSEYRKAIAHSPQIRDLAGDEYSVCLVRCIENMAGWLDHKQLKGRIEYVFEAGCNSQAEATDILKRISSSSELKRRYRWHDYSFREKRPEIPQIFAPDLLAWEWQRARVNAFKPRRGEWRLTLHKLTHGVPHVPEYQTATGVGIRAMVNLCYGLTHTKGLLQLSVV